MNALPNITLAKFSRLEDWQRDEYVLVLQFIQGEQIIKVGDFTKIGRKAGFLKFGQVQELRHNLSDNISNAFWWMYGVNYADYHAMKIMQFYQGLNWIVSELNELSEIESGLKDLVRSSPRMEKMNTMVDTSELDQFKELNWSDDMAQMYHCMPSDIDKMLWVEVITLRKRAIVNRNIQVEMEEFNNPETVKE
jgi:hypothetical protein